MKGIYYYRKSLEYSTKNDTTQMVLTKLNIASYLILLFNKGLPYLNFINKHHSKFGNESTIVALNMLNGMYYCYKNEPKSYFIL
jgi:hypothetical protein